MAIPTLTSCTFGTDGTAVVQAGKQLEILSGGLVKAGYHEVVYNQATEDARLKLRKERPGRPEIRISSTLVRSPPLLLPCSSDEPSS